jgi:16S rRNA (cytosine967-C5)-methyltransferase
MKPTEKLIDSTADVLTKLLRFEHTADSVLSSHFRDLRSLQSRERAFIAEHAYLVLRRLRWLRAVAGENAGARKLLITALARIEGLGHKQLAPLVSRNEAQWLEALPPSTGEELSLGERTDLPDWVVERLLTQMNEESLLSLARSLNVQAPLDLRINLMKTDIDAVTATLTNNGLTVTPGRYSPWALRLAERPSLTKNPLYEKGIIEVQDEGSQLLALLLAPKRGEMVVDFCAGAGGKTLALGAMMRSTGRLYAFDVSEKRLAQDAPARCAIGPVERASGADRQRERHQGEAPRGQDRSCAGRCPLLRPGYAAPQSRSQMAADAEGRRRTGRQAARDPRRCRTSGEAGRTPRLCHLQPARCGKPRRDRRLPGQPPGVRPPARERIAGGRPRRPGHRHRSGTASRRAWHRRFLRGRDGATRCSGTRQGRSRRGNRSRTDGGRQDGEQTHEE